MRTYPGVVVKIMGGEHEGRNERAERGRTGCGVERGVDWGKTEAFQDSENPILFINHSIQRSLRMKQKRLCPLSGKIKTVRKLIFC